MSYYINAMVGASFEKAVDLVKDALQKEGFGVLTEIDMRDTMKKKLDVEIRNYRILGACNPPFAYKALQAEERIGLLLPCNVIIRERTDGTVEAAAIDPETAMQSIDNPALKEVARQVREKLQRVIAGL
jgi:uncharacterized protein (DUF302 family)